ncbi:MAG: DUF445 family protein [Bacteroidia bacterium]|nr:DUF445 family protein [Bacteroidia bacterium]
MIDTLQRYLKRYFPLETLFEAGEKPEARNTFNQFRLDGRKRIALAALKFSPWLCAIMFGATLILGLLSQLAAWIPALGGIAAWRTAHLETIKFMDMLSISGLIGYGTNAIAIRMLFRPVKPRPVWGQGLIPAQRERIIHALAQGMHKHILSQELIRRRIEETGLASRLSDLALDGAAGLIQDQELRTLIKDSLYASMEAYAGREDVRLEIRQLIDTRLEQNLDGGLKKFLLQTYKRYQKEDYEEIIDRIVADIPKLAVEVINRLERDLDAGAAWLLTQKAGTEARIMEVFTDLLNRIDITTLLARQMEHFDEARLEQMIWEATNEQLIYIQYLGAVLGVMGGLVIWRPEVMGIGILLLLGVLYALDEWLVRLRRPAAAPAAESVPEP